MWAIGIVKLFSTAKPFEIIVDIIIIVAVMVAAALLSKIKPANE
jgi:NSS family neurotransmitter:Na+ symporter